MKVDNVLSESFDICISKIDFYYTMEFSQCVHGMYDEKTEAVQWKYSQKYIYQRDSEST